MPKVDPKVTHFLKKDPKVEIRKNIPSTFPNGFLDLRELSATFGVWGESSKQTNFLTFFSLYYREKVRKLCSQDRNHPKVCDSWER
jgi:hypothetical protein